MARRTPPRSENLRRALAAEAARIMIDHGIDDFLQAKRKAAERFAITDRGVLPKNVEIEAALHERQRLFAADAHARKLQSLRRSALETMSLLDEFEPRLVGPVLSGAITEHSDIQLHLFAEAPEVVTLRLIDEAIPHTLAERRVRFAAGKTANYPAILFDAEHARVEATVFPPNGVRQAPCSPVDGRPMRRARAEEVEKLLGQGSGLGVE